MEINKPIFTIGTGRCGSTIFQNIYSHHPAVTWLSPLCDMYPKKPGLNRWLMHIIDFPGIGDFITKKIKPVESYRFWEYYCKGFSRPFRDLTDADVTSNSKKNLIKIFERLPTKKRNRLIIKITGWPRVKFLKKIFPDAKFINVIRDGRAFVNSIINIYFWKGWEGPQNWRWGMLNEEQEKRWESYNKSFIILAAIEWEILMDAFEIVKKSCDKSQFIEVKYEDLMADPIKIFKEVVDFSELEWSTNFENKIKKFKLKNMNYKWQENLSKEQKDMLNEYLKPYLKKFEYI